MLIDAAHPEETRVAIVEDNNMLMDYDFKSTFKNTVKSNIYLAKVARVEPSLQAAFIDYGGNRHGFLAFSEIHPDYFRIPVADRERIDAELKGLINPESADADSTNHSSTSLLQEENISHEEDHHYKMSISTVGGDTPLIEDEGSDNVFRRLSLHRRYKIQEVIHRHQILLIQVVKEERGGKGAALTTYLSLPGRYCVLMPNSPRSGGISRKISNPLDRKRLRKVLDSLEIPDGMGLIIRTAGKERTKIELRRDAEYLMRLWNTIRENTLKSIAPAVIYEEDDIIKRAIRDLYSKDIENILVEGEEGYKIARNFMKTLMPSHVKRISYYKSEVSPLFHHLGVERQIEQMHEAQVFLPSGGSIVIHPTEALISIDVNSGRATRERHIEETAVKTNLEAAVESARQIRLRNLAGLFVIDFIDMDDPRNIAAVERRVKEVFRNDRARVQVGKISPFGLLELSRQRLCPSILETSAYPCPHCDATGYVRSMESKALQILRAVEEQGIAYPSHELLIGLPGTIASYIFNKKREHLSDIERRHILKIQFELQETLEKPGFKITATKRAIVIDHKTDEHTSVNQPLHVDSNDSTINDDNDADTNLISSDNPEVSHEQTKRSSNHRRRQKRRRNHQNKISDQVVTENVSTPLMDIDTNPLFIGPQDDHESYQPLVNETVINDSHHINTTDDNNVILTSDNTHSDHEKRRRRRRHHRRPVRHSPRQEHTEGESHPISTMITAEQPLVSLPHNQNLEVQRENKSSSRNDKTDQTAIDDKKQNKGWLRRLLE